MSGKQFDARVVENILINSEARAYLMRLEVPSIATRSTPLANEPWGLSNQMTARALDSIGQIGGPRCCKRDSWLAILAAIDFAREHLGIEMMRTVPVCDHSKKNNQCIGKRCPFAEVNHEKA